ncbi:hypothetical protein FB566_3182 [Stackebrandtia endophytica]|uniref:Secreted protein n=1 Tax=Stackebrandtia endophytica TaxID=1496996 RepID=A0A543AYG7_9ACTN|nr:hypothetical protein [Stackebrandtia endophytica]TQL77622.1 hypothetical protein FB566_3182 [Stackebrandtia endophytica]
MNPLQTIKRGVLIAFMSALVALMIAPLAGAAQAESPVEVADVDVQAGVTYDKYNCYVQWYSTYGKNVCGGKSKQPNGWVALSLWCKNSLDYYGRDHYMKKGQKKDPIDFSTCVFEAGGGKNTWS